MANITPDLGSVQTSLSGITGGIIIWLIILLVIAYIAIRIVTFVLSQAAEVLPYYRTRIKMIIPFAKIIIYILVLWNVIGVVASPQIGFTEIVTFFGVSGAILAFGIKDLFADFVGGIVIMVETPFQIGDKVTFGEHYGEVTDIGLRSTRLVTPDDSQVSVPNYSIFTDPTTSNNTGNLTMLVVTDIFIDARCPAETALRIARDAAVTSKYASVSKVSPCTVLLNDFPFYRQIRIKAYASDLRYEFLFNSDITNRVWEEFRKQGIQPPKMQVLLPEKPDEKKRTKTDLSGRSDL